jgi:hypothetical protein
MIIAVVALGLILVLMGFRDAVGNLTNQTSVTISRSGGGGGGGGGARPGGGGKKAPETPQDDPEDGDSTSAVGSEGTAAGNR